MGVIVLECSKKGSERVLGTTRWVRRDVSLGLPFVNPPRRRSTGWAPIRNRIASFG